ncbi:hypothetical protein PR048_013979 [Dryococelus australis]|uniref:Uncharacterized protein n=1 Tax=Dryococelus australis TaxID=614101 RepID=A0ABQ9HTQ4_9NEOP|nr:hypothetical protein PR048_013979 [Dryococelus australis]
MPSPSRPGAEGPENQKLKGEAARDSQEQYAASITPKTTHPPMALKAADTIAEFLGESALPVEERGHVHEPSLLTSESVPIITYPSEEKKPQQTCWIELQEEAVMSMAEVVQGGEESTAEYLVEEPREPTPWRPSRPP